MKITATKRLKKSLVLLYIDGEEAMEIDKKTFEESIYKVGAIIDDEELFELVNLSKYNRAKERAYYLLERRNYSKRELINKISLAYDKEVAVKVADKVEELGFINDKNYAQMLARDLFNIKKYGKQRVKSELFRKGIDKEIISEILDDEEVEAKENIQMFLERKYPLWNEDEKVKRRAISALQRRGYSFSEIFATMRSRSPDGQSSSLDGQFAHIDIDDM